ncbi:MAG: glycosyltransferase family 2 protein [Selenomonadaceae bacterium]|nr:glycosyltransferase family 2 protein [Selenomonadaceae bacterium]
MAKVSVLILARNEEKFIGACLDSVKDFADEIIVIDDCSTDTTAEICKRHGAKVFQRALNGDWGAQQTFAVNQATCDWIFIIDADERVTPELAEEIKKILRVDDKNFAYRVARLSYFWGQPLKHGGWFPDYVTRLLPKAGTYVEGLVHQKICHQCKEVDLPSSKYLVHYPYRDWEHYFSKFNVYTTLAAKKMYDAGKSASLFDVIAHPFWAAFRMYFLRGGFLDGRIGFILSFFHYFYTMAKYVKLWYFGKENQHVTEDDGV